MGKIRHFGVLANSIGQPPQKVQKKVLARETREGWPLLTVETEVNGDSKSTNERGPSLAGSLGLLCWYKIFLFCLGCSSRPSTKYFFFLTMHFSIPLSLSPRQAGHAGVLGRLAQKATKGHRQFKLLTHS
jgi:hypothetical protein